jgi:hypothetical protein
VVRIPLERDRRIFTSVARCSQKWEKAYARRTAVERVNSRVDKLLGFEHHTIRGQAKMEMRRARLGAGGDAGDGAGPNPSGSGRTDEVAEGADTAGRLNGGPCKQTDTRHPAGATVFSLFAAPPRWPLTAARRPVEACAGGLGPYRPSSRRPFGRLSSRRDPDSAKGSFWGGLSVRRQNVVHMRHGRTTLCQ